MSLKPKRGGWPRPSRPGFAVVKHIQPQAQDDMTTEKKVVLRKLFLLELAGQLGNVSKACRIVGDSRQQFCENRHGFGKPGK